LNIRIESKSKDLQSEITKAFGREVRNEETCGVCLAVFKSTYEKHSQQGKSVCCRCLRHDYGKCV
jgi:hypothetical protein